MTTADRVVLVLGLAALLGYGWLAATGRVQVRDEQGRVRPIVYIGGLGVLLVLAGVVMNATE